MSPEAQPTPATAVSAPAARAGDAIVVNPATGEVLDLAVAPTTAIAEWRADLIELKWQLDALAHSLDDEVARRLDFEGHRSAQVGDWDLSVEAPTVVSWEVEMLGFHLEALVTDGRISRGVAERCLERVVTFKPRPVELKRLLAHADPEVRRSIEECRSENTRSTRRVAVKRRHP